MKNNFIKYIFFLIIIIIIVIASLVIFNIKKDKYSLIKKMISNTFFYLSYDEYTDMNDISDNCKISLLLDYEKFKSDSTLEESGHKIKGYSKNNILRNIKKTIGKNSSINFSINENDSYDFIDNDECFYNNSVFNLSYNSTNQILYSQNMNTDDIKRVLIKWNSVETNGNIIQIEADALLLVKNKNDYSLFVDKDMNYKIGDYKTIKEAKRAASNNYIKSNKYNFIFYKKNDDYIWKSFKRKKDLSDMSIE